MGQARQAVGASTNTYTALLPSQSAISIGGIAYVSEQTGVSVPEANPWLDVEAELKEDDNEDGMSCRTPHTQYSNHNTMGSIPYTV